MAQKYEKLVQEDLYTGTERVWSSAPGGGKFCSTQIGLHSFARGRRAYTATWAPGSISAGSKASTTVSVPDAVTGDFVMASHTTLGDTGLTIHGHISATGTASVVIHNPSGTAVSVSSGTVSVLVFGAYDASVPISISGFTSVGEGGYQDGTDVYLYLSTDLVTPIDSTVSSGGGAYTFSDVADGDYYVRGIAGIYGGSLAVTVAGASMTDQVVYLTTPESPTWPPV